MINNHISTTLVCKEQHPLPPLACHQSQTKGTGKKGGRVEAGTGGELVGRGGGEGGAFQREFWKDTADKKKASGV